MNDQQRAAMQMALEALEVSTDWDVGARGKQLQSMKAITALREALAEQAEQEPVAYTNSDQLGYLKDPLYENAPMAMWSKPFDKRINIPLYAAPVRTKDLTDDEIVHLVNSVWFLDELVVAKVNFARAVIAADREKNK